jgi:hypothetical protein
VKQTARLLKNTNEHRLYRIRMRLQEGRTALFEYSDHDMARQHYDELRFHGVIGGVAIRDIAFEETKNVKSTNT